MNTEERMYKDALISDFMKYSNMILLAYFLKTTFKDPNDQLDTLMETWVKRISVFRTSLMNDIAEKQDIDPDVARILSSIGDGFDKDKLIVETKNQLVHEVRDLLIKI